MMSGGSLRLCQHREGSKVPVIGWIPIPVTPSRGGSKCSVSDFYIGIDRKPSQIIAGSPGSVMVDQPVERVLARWGIIKIGDDLVKLAVICPKSGCHPCNHLGVAVGPLSRGITRKGNGGSVRWQVQQLATDAQVVQVIHFCTGFDVLKKTISLCTGKRESGSQFFS